jgi:hypothetical protein
MKKFAALTTVLLATALVSPMALAKGMKGSVHSLKTNVVRTEKSAPEAKKMVRAQRGHQRRTRKNVTSKPAIKGQKTQPNRV